MTRFKLKLVIAIAMYFLFFGIFILTGGLVTTLTINQLLIRVITKLVLTNGVFILIYDYYGKYKKLFTSVLLITLSSIIFPIMIYLSTIESLFGSRIILGLVIFAALLPVLNIVLIIKYHLTNVLPSELAKPLIMLATVSLFTDSIFVFVFLSPLVVVFTNSIFLLFVVAPLPIMFIKLYFFIQVHRFQKKPARATLNYSN